MPARLGVIALVFGLTLAAPLNAQENVSHPEGHPASAQEQSADKPAVEPSPVEPAVTFPANEASVEHNQGASTDINEDPYQYPDIILGDGWAQWAMAILSLFALGVSAWAVWLLRDTLKATREAVRAADDAVDVTREMGQRQIRAYISIVYCKVQRHPDKGIATITITFANRGQTPAFKTQAVVARSVAKRGEPRERIFFREHLKDGSISDIPPGQFNTAHCDINLYTFDEC